MGSIEEFLVFDEDVTEVDTEGIDQSIGDILGALANSPGVVKFTATQRTIDDERGELFATAIRATEKMQYLEIYDCQLTPAAVIAIANAVALNNTILELVLIDNKIGRMGDDVLVSVNGMIRDNQRIEHLTFSEKDVGIEGITAVTAALALNTKIKGFTTGGYLLDNACIAKIVEAATANPQIEELTIRDSESITQAGYDRIAEFIRTAPNITSFGLAGFQEMRTAAVQSIANALINTDERGNLIENTTRLKTLILIDCSVGDEGAGHIARAMSRNTSLAELIINNADLHMSGLAAIIRESTRNLEALSLSGNAFGRTRVTVGNAEVDNLAATGARLLLQNSTKLRELQLAECGIGDGIMDIIATGLVASESLEIVVLRNNPIGSAGMETVAGIMSLNTPIRTYDLREITVTPPVLVTIAVALQSNTHATTVHLDQRNSVGEPLDRRVRAEINGYLARNTEITNAINRLQYAPGIVSTPVPAA